MAITTQQDARTIRGSMAKMVLIMVVVLQPRVDENGHTGQDLDQHESGRIAEPIAKRPADVVADLVQLCS